MSLTVLEPRGEQVRWQTVYNLLDEARGTTLTETARWTLREVKGTFIIDLEWRGEARTDVTIGQLQDSGGLFLRMPWREGMRAEVVNAARQRDARAEGQPAMWIDVGMQIDGRDDLAHVAIFDHPDNAGYPQAWRVDSQLGAGGAAPSPRSATIPSRRPVAEWTTRSGSRPRPWPRNAGARQTPSRRDPAGGADRQQPGEPARVGSGQRGGLRAQAPR